jgi:pyrimidine operon attenuation protein / uracil phosphoribosyltransferase
MDKKLLYNHQKLNVTLNRLAFELVENYGDFSDAAIVGLQPRGVLPARIIKDKIESIIKKKVLYGELDITFYRDDFRTSSKQLTASPIHIPFSTEGLKIILIDDVLYTGRSIRSAMDALVDFGRPDKIELCVLIDRIHHRENPISADYVGKAIDTRGREQTVQVDWEENNYKVWLKTHE